MIIVTHSVRRVSRISRRLMFAIIAFSSLVTLVITGFQLFIDYRQQVADVDDLMGRVGVSLPPIADSVWSFNDEQIDLSLKALVNLPNMASATIVDSNGRKAWTARSTPADGEVRRVYPLTYENQGRVETIATLTITATLDGIYDRILWQALTLLLSNGLKTFLVAGFMYALIRHMVTLRIEELARRVNGLIPELKSTQVSFFDESQSLPAKGDEIDAVSWAFDNLTQRLRLVIMDLNARNSDLLTENQERRRAEDDLKAVVDQLSAAIVELERFAYVAAHDLQEPIRSIVSFSQLLERRCGSALGDDGKDYLAFIIGEATRLSSLVLDLLEYSRCRNQEMGDEQVDCNKIMADITADLTALIAQKQGRIISDDLPVLWADPVQMRQLFLNLVGNGLKYHRPGIPPEIRVSARQQGDMWHFSVADNGIGIDAQYETYIFEIFRRLHTRDSYPGTGVGLALCKRVVENHGGQIGVISAPGQGATFWFTMPHRTGPHRDPAALAQSNPAVS